MLHGSEVTLFYEMPITRVRSNVIGVARLCAKYVNTASEVKFHVQSGTDETKNKALLWKPVEARKIGLKSAQPQMILLKTFSHDLRKNNGQNRVRTTWKTRSALASSQFQMTVFPVVTGFLYRLRTQTKIRQKVYLVYMKGLIQSRVPNEKEKDLSVTCNWGWRSHSGCIGSVSERLCLCCI